MDDLVALNHQTAILKNAVLAILKCDDGPRLDLRPVSQVVLPSTTFTLTPMECYVSEEA